MLQLDANHTNNDAKKENILTFSACIAATADGRFKNTAKANGWIYKEMMLGSIAKPDNIKSNMKSK